MKNKKPNRVLAVALCILPLYGGAVFAAGEGKLGFELNNARQAGGNCRLSFVIQNRMPMAIEALSLEIVLFNSQGLVDQFLKLKAGALPKGKMRVKQFDLKGRNCADISKILINEIAECKGADLGPSSCAAALSLSSRTSIELQL